MRPWVPDGLQLPRDRLRCDLAGRYLGRPIRVRGFGGLRLPRQLRRLQPLFSRPLGVISGVAKAFGCRRHRVQILDGNLVWLGGRQGDFAQAGIGARLRVRELASAFCRAAGEALA